MFLAGFFPLITSSFSPSPLLFSLAGLLDPPLSFSQISAFPFPMVSAARFFL